MNKELAVPGDIEVAVAAIFDAHWYLENNPDVRRAGLEPIAHWLEFGWRESRKPSPYFDAAWYSANYPDVGSSDLNPLLHYIRFGDYDGRQPAPYFDTAWYRRAYEIAASELALGHFMSARKTGLFAPCAELYSALHLKRYLAESLAGGDPFARALEDAGSERRSTFIDQEVIATSGLLDRNFYLIHGTDVHEAQMDPVLHFCRFGWRERRKPNIYFDTDWYIRTNPTVARLQINPLMHYILVGENDGRRPVVYFDPQWYRATYPVDPEASALAHYLAHRRDQLHSPNPMFDVTWYVRRLGDQIGANRDPFAHYLQAGTLLNVDPSPDFGSAEYRRKHLGRPSRLFPQNMNPERHNPLVHYLRTMYK